MFTVIVAFSMAEHMKVSLCADAALEQVDGSGFILLY